MFFEEFESGIYLFFINLHIFFIFDIFVKLLKKKKKKKKKFTGGLRCLDSKYAKCFILTFFFKRFALKIDRS